MSSPARERHSTHEITRENGGSPWHRRRLLLWGIAALQSVLVVVGIDQGARTVDFWIFATLSSWAGLGIAAMAASGYARIDLFPREKPVKHFALGAMKLCAILPIGQVLFTSTFIAAMVYFNPGRYEIAHLLVGPGADGAIRTILVFLLVPYMFLLCGVGLVFLVLVPLNGLPGSIVWAFRSRGLPVLLRVAPVAGYALILGILPLAVGAVMGLDSTFDAHDEGIIDVANRLAIVFGVPPEGLGYLIVNHVHLWIARAGGAVVVLPALLLVILGAHARLLISKTNSADSSAPKDPPDGR